MDHLQSTSRSKFGDYSTITLQLENGAQATILPAVSAHLLDLKLPVNRELISVIDGYKNPEDLELLRGAKSSKLSPFPNRIEAGAYSFNNKNYQFPLGNRPNAIHGFVRKQAFSAQMPLVKKKEISLTLDYMYDGNFQAYPFPFSIKLTYILQEKGLICQTLVKNEGTQPMPYGDGWHPYFHLACDKIDELALQLPPCLELLTNTSMIPTMKTRQQQDFLAYTPIADTVFDTGFQLLETTKQSDILLRNSSKELNLRIRMDSNQSQYRYFQIYTPPHRKSIAIEPMSCAANAFNNGMGLIVLQAGEVFEAGFGMYV